MRSNPAVRAAKKEMPKCFVSFSTGEPQFEIFFECLTIVFRNDFELVRTPSALVVGESQHDAIIKSIVECAFGVVCLDGLRPNVLYEYGVMRGARKPVLVFKERSALVDIKHYFGDVPDLALKAPPIDVDKHFSDTKDKFYLSWNRYEIRGTLKIIWDAYNTRCVDIHGFDAIAEPKV
jgi:hypothetical protein